MATDTRNDGSQEIEALLFDLGGVVFRVDFTNAFSRWAHYSGNSREIIRSRFSFDLHYERHVRRFTDIPNGVSAFLHGPDRGR